MSYKVELSVVTSGGNELPADLKEFADAHGITYEVTDAGSDRSVVTFESQGRDQLEDMIRQSYAPSKETEWSQFISQIHAEGVDAGQESFLTQGTREVPPHVYNEDEAVEPAADSDDEDEIAEHDGEEDGEERISSQTIASDAEKDDHK
ncbi:hypothetical protein pEaSNUABM5_00259 [Erwinia phage pEa_SNUABM_5]|uniref:Uncharacterized protein n=1 Tax=Erwinia phage pEa_SNUABM_5 TaxID=2797313 RepID=A0A7T8EPQ4_9CAUD|nr:hypothetical protein MPK73_gp259 [Erwinia phage pEa_SNUABM_5]QQO90401.1 hypothetical protein pEaSNUABM5_00259 [Erwinia phage pEa_SNUABM_5]